MNKKKSISKKYLRFRHRLQNAIKSFGKWGHRKGKSVDIVNNLRCHDDREHIK